MRRMLLPLAAVLLSRVRSLLQVGLPQPPASVSKSAAKKVAAAVVNGLLNEYVAYKTGAESLEGQATARDLGEEVESFAILLTEAEESLRRYQETHQLVHHAPVGLGVSQARAGGEAEPDEMVQTGAAALAQPAVGAAAQREESSQRAQELAQIAHPVEGPEVARAVGHDGARHYQARILKTLLDRR